MVKVIELVPSVYLWVCTLTNKWSQALPNVVDYGKGLDTNHFWVLRRTGAGKRTGNVYKPKNAFLQRCLIIGGYRKFGPGGQDHLGAPWRVAPGALGALYQSGHIPTTRGGGAMAPLAPLVDPPMLKIIGPNCPIKRTLLRWNIKLSLTQKHLLYPS